VYVGGYNPMVILEELLNLLIRKGIMTKAEADAMIHKAKAPDT
jgi:hypothetical protein